MSARKNHRAPMCFILAKSKQKVTIPALAALQRSKEICRCCYDAQETLAVIREIWSLYGYKPVEAEKAEEALVREFDLLHQLSKEGKLMSYLKYKTALMFAWAMDQDADKLPAFPDELKELKTAGGKSLNSPVLVGGGYYAFQGLMKRNLDSKRRVIGWEDKVVKARSFFYSILQSKKGLPRPTVKDCREAVVKAYTTMTKPMERSVSDLLGINRVMGKVKELVKRMFGEESKNPLIEATRKARWSEYWGTSEMEFPSVSSHFGYSRKDLGALGAIKKAGLSVNARYEVVDREEICEDDGMYVMDLKEETRDELVKNQAELVKCALDEPATCAPQALPEPLKVRVVTAGPPLTYTALKPVQKLLFKTMSQDDRFCIGGPVSGEKILQVLGRLEKDKKWLSGDYKAATDNLAMELSVCAVEEIAKATCMPKPILTLFRKALTEHWYTYDKNFGNKKKGVDWAPLAPQSRGQLMGSPVSFPILCIANFCLIWEALNPELPFDQVRVIVNGDDCLFQTDDAGYQAWAELAGQVGLTPSVGKTYFSRDFCVINSEFYSYDMLVSRQVDLWVHVVDGKLLAPNPFDCSDKYILEQDYLPYLPYVNMGLLRGIKKSGDKETSCEADSADPTSKSIGGRARTLVRGWESDSEMFNAIMRSFRSCNSHLLEGLGNVPEYIPENWGGLGLPYLTVSRKEMRKAQWLTSLQGLPKLRTANKANSVFYKACKEDLCKRFGKVAQTTQFSAGHLIWNYTDMAKEEEVGNVDIMINCWKCFSDVGDSEGDIEAEQSAWTRVWTTSPVVYGPAVRLQGQKGRMNTMIDYCEYSNEIQEVNMGFPQVAESVSHVPFGDISIPAVIADYHLDQQMCQMVAATEL